MSPVKPTCDLECASCRYQLDPTHCAEVVSGEAAKRESEVEGLRAENERLRRELAEIGGAFSQSEQYREADTATIDRLRSELAEMTGCATRWCAEGGRSEREHRETLVRCRTAAQILIAEIGASGPEDVEETARRAVARIQELKSVCEDLCSSCDPSIHIERLTEALRDLVATVTATKTRDTIVLRDLEAARAVLGGQS